MHLCGAQLSEVSGLVGAVLGGLHVSPFMNLTQKQKERYWFQVNPGDH